MHGAVRKGGKRTPGGKNARPGAAIEEREEKEGERGRAVVVVGKRRGLP